MKSQNDRIILFPYQGKPFNITVIQVHVPTTDAEETEVDWFCEDLQHLLELTPKEKKKKNTHKTVFFIIVDYNIKVGSQEIPGLTGKFGLEVQNEGRQRLVECCQPQFSNSPRDDSACGHHHMVNIEIRSIMVFAVEDGEVLYSQQKQSLELTMAQIMSSLLKNSGLS